MADLKTHAIPPRLCFCGYRLECGSGIDAEAPTEGCLSVCWNCGQVMEFTADLDQRALTDEEVAALPADLRFQLRAFQSVHSHFKLRKLRER